MQINNKKNIILKINKLNKVFDEGSNNSLEAVKEVSLNILKNDRWIRNSIEWTNI